MTSKIEDETMTSGTYEFTSHGNIVDLEKRSQSLVSLPTHFFLSGRRFFSRERASFQK